MIILVGINPFDFEKNGERVTGVSCHVTNDTPDNDNFIGVQTLKFSLSKEKFQQFLSGRTFDDVVGTEVDITYNQYGRVGRMISVNG